MKSLRFLFSTLAFLFLGVTAFAQNTQKEKTEPKPPKPPKFEIVEEKETGEEPEFEIEAGDLEEEQSTEEEVFTVVEDMPEFPGGQEAMYEYIRKNLVYPQEDAKAGNEGRVILSFVITKTGRTRDVKVMRKGDGVSDAMALSAIKLIEEMPKWSAGKQRGKAVAVKYNLPINFSLGK